MVLKVDLQCSSCYKKIKKILCKFPEIRDQIYDEKKNTVTIIVVCCSPEKVRDKLCCKGGKTIKSIEIKEPPKPKPPEEKPDKPKPSEKPTNPPAPPAFVPVCYPPMYPVGICCGQCYKGHTNGPCYHGHGRPVPPCDNYGCGPCGCGCGGNRRPRWWCVGVGERTRGRGTLHKWEHSYSRKENQKEIEIERKGEKEKSNYLIVPHPELKG
ncbi:hypothetical protein HYC85_017548 [Camellia sinensis]|uniref:HMA domain-containing protein n=1 Tax=Camellia sinensis TaxID=4442 RepID=A0A7J7GU69_CAMSI|nr:hypothetical protein HYC85_017548 [Camellia sinensis]